MSSNKRGSDNFFVEIFKSMFVGIFSLLLPLGMIVLGGMMVGAGINYEMPMLGWTGAGILAAGVVWGAIIFLVNSATWW